MATQVNQSAVIGVWRNAPLPESLSGDSRRLTALEATICGCVHGLYNDKIVPTWPELRKRLEACGTEIQYDQDKAPKVSGEATKTNGKGTWTHMEIASVPLICARLKDVYTLALPTSRSPLAIYLKQEPEGFSGFCWPVKEQDLDPFSKLLWSESRTFLATKMQSCDMKGGIAVVAKALHERDDLPPSLKKLSLGEFRRWLWHALRPNKALMQYDPLNGNVIRANKLTRSTEEEDRSTSPEEGTEQGYLSSSEEEAGASVHAVAAGPHSTTDAADKTARTSDPAAATTAAIAADFGTTAAAAATTATTAETVTPETAPAAAAAAAANNLLDYLSDNTSSNFVWPGYDAIREQIRVGDYMLRLGAVQQCIQSFYYQQLEPTLPRVQERLVQVYGWTPFESMFVSDFGSRHPEYFLIFPATSTSSHPTIHLATTPPQTPQQQTYMMAMMTSAGGNFNSAVPGSNTFQTPPPPGLGSPMASHDAINTASAPKDEAFSTPTKTPFDSTLTGASAPANAASGPTAGQSKGGKLPIYIRTLI